MPYGYIGTRYRTYKAGEIVYTEDGTPYRAVGDSELAGDGRHHMTPVDQLSQEEENKRRRSHFYDWKSNP
jgi:hypothetical protein